MSIRIIPPNTPEVNHAPQSFKAERNSLVKNNVNKALTLFGQLLESEGMVVKKKAGQVLSPSPARSDNKVRTAKLSNLRELSPEIDCGVRKSIMEISNKRASKTTNDLDYFPFNSNSNRDEDSMRNIILSGLTPDHTRPYTLQDLDLQQGPMPAREVLGNGLSKITVSRNRSTPTKETANPD